MICTMRRGAEFSGKNEEMLIEISSDEDTQENLQQFEKNNTAKTKVLSVLDEFLKKCRMYDISEQTTSFAREIFHEASTEFVTQSKFTAILDEYAKSLSPENAKDLIISIGNCLYKEKIESFFNTSRADQVAPSPSKNHKTSKDKDDKINKNCSKIVPTENGVDDNDDVVILDVRTHDKSTLNAEKPKTFKNPQTPINAGCSVNDSKETKSPGVKKIPCTEEEKKRIKRKEIIKSLKTRFHHYSKEIKKLQETELSLEEMEHEHSSYLRESQLKEKCVKIHAKLCKLQGLSDPLERKSKRSISIVGSPYPEINREAETFIHKQSANYFPDLFDIRDIVKKANNQYKIGLKSNEEFDCAREIFSEMGDKLQRRRKKEFCKYSGSYLADPILMNDDPAEADRELMKKLKRNRKISRENTDKVFRKFLHKQYSGYASSSDDDELSKKVIETQKKFSPIQRKRKPPKLIQDSGSNEGFENHSKIKIERREPMSANKTTNSTSTISCREKDPTEKEMENKHQILQTRSSDSQTNLRMNPLHTATVTQVVKKDSEVKLLARTSESQRISITHPNTTPSKRLCSNKPKESVTSGMKQDITKNIPTCKRNLTMAAKSQDRNHSASPIVNSSNHQTQDSPFDKKKLSSFPEKTTLPVKNNNGCQVREKNNFISIVISDSDED